MKIFFTPSGRQIRKVGPYARVSGKSQEDNTSLANQLKKTRNFAVEHNLEIVGEKFDVITGVSMWGGRKGFNEFLEMGNQGLLDCVICDVPDRLGRDDAIPVLIARAHEQDLEVLFVKQGGPLTSQDKGIAMLTSGEERRRIGERTREGKLNRALAEKIVFSKPPYGIRLIREYDPQSGKKLNTILTFVDEEIEAVRKIFNWLVIDQCSIRGIQRLLYRDEVLPPGLKRKMEKEYGAASWDVPEIWKKSKLWSTSTIRRTLVNEIYVGRWYYNKRVTTRFEWRGKMKQVVLDERQPKDWICLEVEATIPEGLFEQAQLILERNKTVFGGRPSKYKYLLKSLFFCECGRSFIGNGGTGQYRCTGNHAPVQEEKCGAPYLSQKLVETLTWNYVGLMFVSPEKLLAEYEEKHKSTERENAILQEQIARLQADLQKHEFMVDNLWDARLADEMDKPTFKRKKKEYEGQMKKAGLELARAQSQLKAPISEADKDNFFTFCRESMEALDNPTFEQKRQILLKLDAKITFLKSTHSLKIEGIFPTADLACQADDGADPRDATHRRLFDQYDKKRSHQDGDGSGLAFSTVMALPRRKSCLGLASYVKSSPNLNQTSTIPSPK